MAIYAIGDIQGCYDRLRVLLDLLNFNQKNDTLWLVGDLVNRGPQSLEVLRFIKGLGNSAVTVLGNHDMHLLAVSQGNLSHYKDTSLDKILAAPDREELLYWLRHRPLLHHDQESAFTMVHAGLAPQWDLVTAKACAREVEIILQGDGFLALMQQLYGNKPLRWQNTLTGIERIRHIINCFTRLRYCTVDGTLALKAKGAPGTQISEFMPWFDVPNRASSKERIIFGHWSTLGYISRRNVWALDTGCLWGGQLTALQIDKNVPKIAMQIDCNSAANPFFI